MADANAPNAPPALLEGVAGGALRISLPRVPPMASRPVPDAPADLVSVRQAARRLGISARIVYRLVLAGQVPARRVGRAYAINPAHVRYALADEATATATATPPLERAA